MNPLDLFDKFEKDEENSLVEDDSEASSAVVKEEESPREPFDSHMAKQILANNRGLYRLHNFQEGIRDDEAV